MNFTQRTKRLMFLANRLGYYYPKEMFGYYPCMVGISGGTRRQGQFECPACKGFGHYPDYDPYRADPDKLYVTCMKCGGSGFMKKLYMEHPCWRPKRRYKNKIERATDGDYWKYPEGYRPKMLAYQTYAR